MEVGQPSTGAPDLVVEKSCELLKTNALPYTASLGIPELKTRISVYYLEHYGVKANPDNIVVCTGSSASFLLSFLAAFDVGDKVILTSPTYPCYRNILMCLGVEIVLIEVDADTKFQPTTELLSKALEEHGSVQG